MTEMSPSQTRERKKSWALFTVAALLTFLAFYGMFLDQLFVCEDVNMESMDSPLTVAHLERAREKGVSASAYFQSDPVWDNLKEQDPHSAYAYYGKRFQFAFFAFEWPLLNSLFAPFVKLHGVDVHTVYLYSTFFAALAWIATGLLALRMFGCWTVLPAMLFLISSLSWLIHTKVGYSAHMPSAALMIFLALASYAYGSRAANTPGLAGRAAPLVVMGCLIGVSYLESWVVIVFGALMAGLSVVLNGPRRVGSALSDLGLVVAAAAASILLFTAAYGAYYHCTFSEIHGTIYDVCFSRFKEGGEPTMHATLAGRMAYAFRCIFLDSQTVEHLDKCLEGCPAIPPIFSVLFGVGLLYAFKERTIADKTLLIWLVSVFGVLGSVYTFTHRYALMAIPAMSLIAARGVTGVTRDLSRWRGGVARRAFVSGVILLLGFSLFQTHRQYYEDYLLHKPPVFEVDRMRGHASFANWLKHTGSPQDTLVVLGDPIMFPHSCFLFNTFGYDYRFVYWSNYFGSDTTPEQVLEWEREHLARYRRIVYAFSTVLLGNPQTGDVSNDWRPFQATHRNLYPVWTYSYADRPPSIVVYEIGASTFAAATRDVRQRPPQ